MTLVLSLVILQAALKTTILLTGTLTFTEPIDGDNDLSSSNGTASIDAAGVWTYY